MITCVNESVVSFSGLSGTPIKTKAEQEKVPGTNGMNIRRQVVDIAGPGVVLFAVL